MSFILDALERSRQERDAAAGSAAVPVDPGSPAAQTVRSPWVVFLLLALGLALAVIVWLVVVPPDEPGDKGEPEPTAPPLSTSTVMPPAPLVAPSSLQTEVLPQREILADSVSAGAVSDLYRASRIVDSAQVRPLERSDDSSDAAADGASIDVIADANGDIDAMVARAEAALDNLDLAAHPAPMLEDLSQTFRDDIPTLMYTQHDYRSSSESAVYINRERRREGDSIGAVRVQEILPDSVILAYRGTVFRLKALNSWVNL